MGETWLDSSIFSYVSRLALDDCGPGSAQCGGLLCFGRRVILRQHAL